MDASIATTAGESDSLVLIIDDDQSVRESLALCLEAFGYRVKTAEDGVQGLKAIEVEQPAVVVTDLHMPVLDGFEVMAALRNSGLSIPTIVMSGDGGGQGLSLLDCAKSLGAMATLEKPFSTFDLMDLINELPGFSRALPSPAAA